MVNRNLVKLFLFIRGTCPYLFVCQPRSQIDGPRWLAYVIFFLENISRKAQRSVKPIQFSFLRLNNEKSGKFYNNWANRGVGTFSF